MEIVKNIKSVRGPQLLHVVNQKGKGYSESENDPFGMHARSKIAPTITRKVHAKVTPPRLTYSQVFGSWLCDLAENNELAVGITPAMGEGSGIEEIEE